MVAAFDAWTAWFSRPRRPKTDADGRAGRAGKPAGANEVRGVNETAGTTQRGKDRVAPRAIAAGAALAGVVGACALAMIVTRLRVGRAAGDEINFHEPAIRRFYEQWPVFDFSDYLSATTPGYHLLMAAVMKVLGPWEVMMRGAGLLIGCILVGAVGAACAAIRGSAWVGALVALPLAMSLYVQNSTAYLLPDNLGWLGVLAMVLIAGRAARGREGWRLLVPLAGVVLAGLVFVRQIHIWTAALAWAAAWLAAVGPEREGEGLRAALLEQPRKRFTVAAIAGLATVPALLELASFVRLWGGLTPPSLAVQYPGANPAAPAFILALVGAISLFYAAWLARPLAGLWRGARWVIPVAAGLGLIAAILPETTYSLRHGRFSGLWALAKPQLGLVAFGRTSIALAVLAPIGAVALAGWAWRLGTRKGALLLGGAAAFIAAQAASYMLYQRYSEPLVLMVLALCAATPEASRAEAETGSAGARRWITRAAMLGPAVLAAGLGAVTFATLRNETAPAAYHGFEPGGEAIQLFFSERTAETPVLPRPQRPVYPPWWPWGEQQGDR